MALSPAERSPRRPLHGLALFAGAAGLELGIARFLAGLGRASRTVCFVEREAYAAAVLVSRMEEGRLDPAPVWDDVATFDGCPWRGVVDFIAGGFPCQDISNAGRREGILDGEKSGLWREYARIVGEVRPRFVFVENVRPLLVRGIDVVLGDLAALGFDAEWLHLRASDVGAPHGRDRLFLLAYAPVAKLLATPDVPNGGRSDRPEARARGEKVQTGLHNQAALWATPAARDWKGPNGPDNPHGTELGREQLNNQAATWPTPTTNPDAPNLNSNALGPTSLGEAASNWPNLVAAAGLWPTPVVTDSFGAARGTTTTDVMHPGTSLTDAMREWEGTAPPNGPTPPASGATGLPDRATPKAGATTSTPTPAERRPSKSDPGEWPTPCAGTNRKSARAIEASRENGRRSGGGQSSPPGLEQVAEIAMGEIPREVSSATNLPQETATLLASAGAANPSGQKSARRVLNPDFVEALMGWPAKWSCASIASDSSVTASSPTRPSAPSDSSPQETPTSRRRSASTTERRS